MTPVILACGSCQVEDQFGDMSQVLLGPDKWAPFGIDSHIYQCESAGQRATAFPDLGQASRSRQQLGSHESLT